MVDSGWQPDCKVKAGGTVREIDVWAESPRLSRLWFSLHHRLPVWAVNHYRGHRHSGPSATKMPENWSWRTRQLLTCRCVGMMCYARCKIHEGVGGTGWKMMSAWWCCRWSSSVCTSKQSVSQWGRPPPPPAWIMQPPRLADTAERIISPSREADHYCKNNWKEPRSMLMAIADRSCHIDGPLMQLLWAIHTRFRQIINTQNNKTKLIHLRMFSGFLF